MCYGGHSGIVIVKQLVQEELAGENSFVQCGEHWYHRTMALMREEERIWERETSRLICGRTTRGTCLCKHIKSAIYCIAS